MSAGDRRARPSLALELENRVEWAPRSADLLAALVAPHIAPERVDGIRLGLTELLTNAIEHGNLGIDAATKRDRLTEGRPALHRLLAERLADPARAARRVRVECRLTAAECEFRIRDEGEGFDPRPYETDEPEEGTLVAGRGILLARSAFDALRFEDDGRTAVALTLLVD